MVLHAPRSDPATLRLGEVWVDLDQRTVRWPDRHHPLTDLEGRLLADLSAHRGRVRSRDALLAAVWGYHPRVVSRAVDHAVWRIRRKIERDPSAPRWLTSQRGGGYRLEREPGPTLWAAPAQLYGAARSHHTRIVRVLCAELGPHAQRVEWVDRPLAGDPLQRAPVLVHGERTLWESDNICRYLVEEYGRDPLGVLSLDWSARNTLAVIHGVTDAERDAVERGLAWLDRRVPSPGPELDYVRTCVVAMWDHLLLRGTAVRDDAPRVAALVDALAARPSLASTRPS